MNNCKQCKSENIKSFNEIEGILYKGEEIQVPMEYSVCDDCGREFISKPQILRNEVAFKNAKKIADRLLSAEAIVEARAQLDITQEQAAKIFGGGRNAFSKYERGEVSQSLPMDRLIRVCLKHRDVFKEIAHSVGVDIGPAVIREESNVIPYPTQADIKAKRYRKMKSIPVEEKRYG